MCMVAVPCPQPGSAPAGFKMPADGDAEGAEGDYDPDAPEDPAVQGQLAPEVGCCAIQKACNARD